MRYKLKIKKMELKKKLTAQLTKYINELIALLKIAQNLPAGPAKNVLKVM
jgi:hypothetical protein